MILNCIPAPPPNPHTIYLESLLQPHYFLLTLRSRLGDGSQVVSTQYRSITQAGLLLGEAIQDQLDLPILRLPAPAHAIGRLEQTVEGELLEGIWYNLTPEAKYAYARQLRHILNTMRLGMAQTPNAATPQAKRNLLGSAFSGTYSLILDQHVQNTYWAVRGRPTCDQFVAFLTSSFVSSVPPDVATALACHFRSDCAIRFTHGELSPRNIVVQNSKIVCILGWDSGGWYPEWWEYVKFFEARTGLETKTGTTSRHTFSQTLFRLSWWHTRVSRDAKDIEEAEESGRIHTVHLFLPVYLLLFLLFLLLSISYPCFHIFMWKYELLQCI